jgi:hypothetical protein
MKGCRFALTVVAPLFLLVACDKSPRFESPVAKTNPNPTQGYEITVELIDPPADIRSIAGEAHFGIPDVSCMHQPDLIAGYTPGSSYIKKFALTKVDENTYQGRIFLDWPIDEDYYGLGVCKWKIATVDAVFIRENGLVQTADMNESEVVSESPTLSYCRAKMRDKYDKICIQPIDPVLIRELGQVSYQVKMSPRRN